LHDNEEDAGEFLIDSSKKFGQSFVMGLAFGVGALISFYSLKHNLMTKLQ
jgi:hypothetical protein